MATPTRESLLGANASHVRAAFPSSSAGEAAKYLEQVPGWQLVDDAHHIRRDWRMKNFVAAIDFFNKVAALAEQEQHHPDLHLTNYRDVRIEIYTHAIGGLSENDFILAAKIDQIRARRPRSEAQSARAIEDTSQ